MHQYICPQCKTSLKREQPVADGKKIKCPKCATIFAPQSAVAAGKGGKPEKGGKGKADEDDLNPYLVVKDEEEDEQAKTERQKAAMGVVTDKFKKSKKGPAISVLVRPANYLLGAGVITCFIAFSALFIGLFPLVFSDFFKQPKETDRKSEEKVAAAQQKWEDTKVRCVIMIVSSFVIFALGATVSVGAFKMRALESYPFSWVGAIMAVLVSPGNGAGVFYVFFYLGKVLIVDTMGLDLFFAQFVGGIPGAAATVLTIVAGVWSIVALTNEDVKAAFQEEKEADI